jgi:hypothetical protein
MLLSDDKELITALYVNGNDFIFDKTVPNEIIFRKVLCHSNSNVFLIKDLVVDFTFVIGQISTESVYFSTLRLFIIDSQPV